MTTSILLGAPMAVRASKAPADTVKTTVELPADLWRAAKIRAMDQRVDLRTVLIEALAAYLRQSRDEARRERP